MYLYVARDKASEWRAIQGLSSPRGLPCAVLVEAVCEPLRRAGKTLSSAPDAVVTRLATRVGALGSSNWVAADLDNLLLDLSAADVAMLVPLLGRFAPMGVLTPLPVVRTSTPGVVRAATYDLARRLGRGLVIRVDGVNQLEQRSIAVASIAKEAGVPPHQIDVVVDAQNTPRFIPIDVLHDSIDLIGSCRSWTFLSGTFPAGVTHLTPKILLHRLDRAEWDTYQAQVLTLGRRRVPHFGDFATQSAVYSPSDPFRPSPSVRYTTADGYLVLRGKRDAPEGHKQFIGHARVLVTLPEFAAVTEGSAEAYVRWIATGANGTGNGTTWRIASLQRHVTLAVAQEAMLRQQVRVTL